MTTRPDVICFSHPRWDGVYERPHHLMSPFARMAAVKKVAS
jgi:UDP-galactopyranose mutase